MDFWLLIKSANIALRFLLELCALAALGYWGSQTGKGTIMKLAMGIGAPLLIAVVWGTFGAPGASVKLSKSLHLLLELVVFGLPAFALYAVRKPDLAWTYGLAVVINRALMFIWEQ
ncbi:YrdB family protein [Ammoniphilus sp. 3BR4]|uniref:YrdB family protein n=1 Tax=Ammoniphilus sp. 3BR4 TaxID=3158265 RepID=UPI0034665740